MSTSQHHQWHIHQYQNWGAGETWLTHMYVPEEFRTPQDKSVFYIKSLGKCWKKNITISSFLWKQCLLPVRGFIQACAIFILLFMLLWSFFLFILHFGGFKSVAAYRIELKKIRHLHSVWRQSLHQGNKAKFRF